GTVVVVSPTPLPGSGGSVGVDARTVASFEGRVSTVPAVTADARIARPRVAPASARRRRFSRRCLPRCSTSGIAGMLVCTLGRRPSRRASNSSMILHLGHLFLVSAMSSCVWCIQRGPQSTPTPMKRRGDRAFCDTHHLGNLGLRKIGYVSKRHSNALGSGESRDRIPQVRVGIGGDY